MEVLFCIPPDLYSRFEYIPTEALPDVLENLLREGLKKVDEQEPCEKNGNVLIQPSTCDLETILSAIKNLQVNTLNKDTTEEVRSVIEIETVEASISEEDDEEGLGDLLEMMK